jgi:hypothetical protein
MSLQRTKTDKADAKLIYEYGRIILSSTEPHFWQPDKIDLSVLVLCKLICQNRFIFNGFSAITFIPTC